MSRHYFLGPFVTLLTMATAVSWADDAAPPDASGDDRPSKPAVAPRFEQEIQPILARACFDCHGGEVQEAQLDLQTVTSILRGGENGHGIVRGDSGRSLLFDMLDSGQMPPEGEEKLTKDELKLIQRWIEAGAPADEQIAELPALTQVTAEDRAYWAFQKPLQQPLPDVNGLHSVRTPIDRFVLHRLEEAGLEFSPPVDRETLLRRAYFNLIGLPPPPEEIDTFVNDVHPGAWERLIDRLLASPHYGERWGRHWLDAVGYVDNRLNDSNLEHIFPNDGIWRYRDYVIRAFNEDKPYDRFLIEQLAGDELLDWRSVDLLTPQMVELLVATGFYRSIVDHTSAPEYGLEQRYNVVFDTMKMVSSSLMGLTLECSRCHNHKYDPISQRDYYRMMATLEPALNPRDWLIPQKRSIPMIAPDERKQIDQHNDELDQQIEALHKKRIVAENADDRPKAERIRAEIDQLEDQKQHYERIQALWDVGPAPQSRVLRRGSVFAAGALVDPGFIEVLSAPESSRAVGSKRRLGKSTGLRLAFAEWLTSRDHPLTARVIVNRVWHQHFGRGLVATPGNFGRSGSLPTHPELLDWLAVDLMEQGWSLKRLHRMMMNSAVFRQSSRRPADGTSLAERIDPGNALLWRMNLRRLESEIVRDTVLASAGRLDTTPGGPPVMITKPGSGLSREEPLPTPTSHLRRSVYLFARRVYPLKFLEVFDAPIVPVNCTKRMQSATVLQSLTRLNDEFMLDHAQHMAQRARLLAGEKKDRQIETCWRLVLARSPEQHELQRGRAYLAEQRNGYVDESATPREANARALGDLCHMLLCTNEFLYVD
jgi:hypothetical protein